MVKVNVKWEKESFDIDVDLGQPALALKTQIFSLTGVLPERQKIMGVKNAPLKDEADMSASGIKEGSKLMMLGRADAIPQAPKNAPVFLEDMPESVQAAAVMKNFSPGLDNLGNTCYMNSVIQCLYSVPELHDALSSYTASAGERESMDTKLTLALRDLFKQIKSSGDSVEPTRFLLTLQQIFPSFAQRSPEGHPMQQDAEECWTIIMNTLSRRLRSPAIAAGASADASGANAMREIFGIDFDVKFKCEQTGEERFEKKTEYVFKCNIDHTISYLNDGFKLACDMSREQRSEILGVDVAFSGVSRISRLPLLLTVQMVRFYWKSDVRARAKILREVAFPALLDVYQFCTDEYKMVLDGPRDRKKKAEEAALGLKMQPDAKKAKQGTPAPLQEAASAEAAVPPVTAGDEAMPDAAAGTSGNEASGNASSGPVPEQTGFFELRAVLTHKGRSADSGHYEGWVKQSDGSWMEFDDEKTIPRKEEEIMKLKGGGDHHMAYLLLYRAVLA